MFEIEDYAIFAPRTINAVNAISYLGENMPHPVKFGEYSRISQKDSGKVVYEHEEPDVLLGAYLNSMFIYNEVVKFYNELNDLILKKDKTPEEWMLVLRYLALKLPPEVDATPEDLARVSEGALTADDIRTALARSETGGLVPPSEAPVESSNQKAPSREEIRVEDQTYEDFQKFVALVEELRKKWDVSEKKAAATGQKAEMSFISEVPIQSDNLENGKLCRVYGDYYKLVAGLKTAFDVVRNKSSVSKSGNENDFLSSEMKMLTELPLNISQHVPTQKGVLAIRFDQKTNRLYVATIDRGPGFSYLDRSGEKKGMARPVKGGRFSQSGINPVGAGIGMKNVVLLSKRILIRSVDTEWTEGDLKSQGVIPGTERKDGLPGSLVAVSVNIDDSIQTIYRAEKIRDARQKLKNVANEVEEFSQFSSLRWKDAVDIPWPKLVRVSSSAEKSRPRDGEDQVYGTEKDRWNDWDDQIYVRRTFLNLIGRALKQNKPLTDEEVTTYLKHAHQRLFLEADDDSLYYPGLTDAEKLEREKKLKDEAGQLNLTADEIADYTQRLNGIIELLAKPETALKEIIRPLFDLHTIIIAPEVPRETNGTFAFPSANILFSMNQINAVMGLLGYEGVPYDGIDYVLLADPNNLKAAYGYFDSLLRRLPRAELREADNKGFQKTREELENRSKLFVAELGERSDLPEYVMSDDFAGVLQEMFGEFADTQALLEKIRAFVMRVPIAGQVEVDAKIVQIMPSEMAKLVQSLATIVNVSCTIGVEMPKLWDQTEFVKNLLAVLSERAGLVNEVAVNGPLMGPSQNAFRQLGISVRPTDLKKTFIARNNQKSVPVVVNSQAINVSAIDGIFQPIMADAESGDPFIREYTDLLKIVSAIHLADLSKTISEPEELKAQLLKKLNLSEQTELQKLITWNASNRTFVISSVAVQLYLEMQAEKSIQRAA